MTIKWFWCPKCDGVHYDKDGKSLVPHLMPFRGEKVKRKKCSCGEAGFIYKSLEAA